MRESVLHSSPEEVRLNIETLDSSQEMEAGKKARFEVNPRKNSSKTRLSRSCLEKAAKGAFPFWGIMKEYSFHKDFFGDLMAGITVGIMHVPQGMVSGQLANTSPVHGLYVPFFAPLIYFFFGTSRHISLGTTAVLSLMVGSAVDKGGCSESLATSNRTVLVSQSDLLECRVGVATVVALMVGIIQICLGVFRLGFVAKYLSDPLTRAFTAAAACHVFTSQLTYLTGIPVGRYTGALKLVKMFIDLVQNASAINWASVLMSAVFGVILIVFKEYINPRVQARTKMPIPIELLVIIVATFISYYGQLASQLDIRIIGDIPRGIPAPVVPDVSRLPEFASEALSIALVAFAMNLTLARLFAKKHNYSIDANQELVSYGLTNAIGSAFNCFPNAAAMSRTLLQDALGGKTQVAGLVSCCSLLIVLYGVGTLFENLPNNILAIIVIVSLKSVLWQVEDAWRLWTVNKSDWMVWMVVFFSTILLDVDLGLLVGVVFCILVVVVKPSQRVADSQISKQTTSAGEAPEPSTPNILFDCPLLSNIGTIGTFSHSNRLFGSAKKSK